MKISKIFKKHYISSIIAFITVIITIAQIWIATIDKTKELELAKITHKDNFIQKQNQIDKTWQYNMTEFMAKHRESIFSDDLKVRENMRDIMLVSFPTEIISPIINNLSKILDDEYKQEWIEAKNVAKRIGQPTVYMQIEEGFPNKILDLIADTIWLSSKSVIKIPKNELPCY